MLELVLTEITRDIIEVNKSQNKGHKMMMSITKLNSKIHKPKLYKKILNNPIYGQQWLKTIKKELQNLENYQTWIYNKLFYDKKAIELK